MTATLERPRPNGLKPTPTAEQVVFVEPTLIESFGNRIIGERELMIMRIIDGIEDIHLFQKRDIYFYHLWQEDPKLALLRIKNLVGEIREDELERVLVRVDRDNFVTEKYTQFHTEFLHQTQEERLLDFRKLLKGGATVEEAAKEVEIDLEIAHTIAMQSSYELFIVQIKKGSTPLQAVKISGIEASESQDLLMAMLVEKHPPAEKVLQLKQRGFKNSQIAEGLDKPIGYVDNLTRAFVFLEIIPSHRSRAEEAKKQNVFLREIIRLRSQGLGNQVISEKLKVYLTKVEEAARFLVWVGLVEPISKRGALLQRYNKKDYKRQVRELIENLGTSSSSSLISLIDLHRNSGLEIGYDKFLRLFHEIEKERGQSVPRYYHRRNRSKS